MVLPVRCRHRLTQEGFLRFTQILWNGESTVTVPRARCSRKQVGRGALLPCGISQGTVAGFNLELTWPGQLMCNGVSMFIQLKLISSSTQGDLRLKGKYTVKVSQPAWSVWFALILSPSDPDDSSRTRSWISGCTSPQEKAATAFGDTAGWRPAMFLGVQFQGQLCSVYFSRMWMQEWNAPLASLPMTPDREVPPTVLRDRKAHRGI